MRALIQSSYGGPDILRFEERPDPTPGAGEVLVRVRAVSLNFGDRMHLLGLPKLFRAVSFGAGKPKREVPGMDGAGVVEAVGEGVTDFAPGDRVFGEIPTGSCAELGLAPATHLAKIPDGVSFEQAATLPVAGVTALDGLGESGGLSSGQRVLINGASGSVGTVAIQIARALGAEVTAVCSTAKTERARALGADEVIDYTRDNYTAGEPRFDLVFDLVGNHSLSERRRVLKPGGTYVASFGQGGGETLGPLLRIMQVAMAGMFSGGRVKMFAAGTATTAQLERLAGWVTGGQLTPVIEQTFAFDDAVDAFTTLLAGHLHGKLVITLP